MDHIDTDLQLFQDLNNHNQCHPTLKTSWAKFMIILIYRFVACPYTVYHTKYGMYIRFFVRVLLEFEQCHIPKAQTKPCTRYWTILFNK